MHGSLTGDVRKRMKRVVVGLTTKSDKIRALGEAGFPRTKIAAFLDVEYRQVRSELARDVKKSTPNGSRATSDAGATPDEQGAMESLVAELPTKSSKIRVLDRAGYSRTTIAKFLGIRYQHVRNVLVQNAPEPVSRQIAVSIDAAGRIVIPAQYRRALGLEDGGEVLLRLEDNELRLFTRSAGIRRAQALVAKYVPKGVSLVDELIAERRREAAAEEVDG